jgi:hypothetical protein
MFILKEIWNCLAKHYRSLLNEQKFKNVSKLKVWYSELVFGIFMLLTKLIRNYEKSKLNTYKIKKYYNLYGKEDTLSHFKLSEKVLEEILSA